MLDCVFHFKYKDQDVYLNGRYGIQYDFIYVGCFCPIDFYEETRNYRLTEC